MKQKFVVRLGVLLVVIGLLVMNGMVFAMEKADTHFRLRKYEKGTEHKDVLHIQNALRQGGYLELEELTTYYGDQTTEAVKAFQKANGLKDDGIAGARTIEVMFEAGLMNELDSIILKPKEKSESVKKLQMALMDINLMMTDDGKPTNYYGKKTEQAVKAYQESKGLEVDGVAGTVTLHELEKDGYLFLASTQGEGEDAVEEVAQADAEFVGNISAYVIEPKNSGEDVRVIQAVLEKEGLLTAEDKTGFYGEKTQEGVKKFQQKYGLESDGVVGSATIHKMTAMGYTKQLAPAPAPVVVSRSSGNRTFGEYITWSDVMETIDKGHTVFVVEDFYTGTKFKVLAAYGGVHSDVEPLSAEDARIIKQLWGGKYGWARRPMLVHHNGRVIAASLNGMPHAGLENQPEGKYVSGRSGGFGYGYNFDSVKGNNFNGHICLHFRDSKTHCNRTKDKKHQKCVRIAAGLE